MGCVSSNLLHHDDEFTQLGSTALTHHIVSLKSSTYGLLTLDPPQTPPTPSTPPTRFTLGSLWSEPRPIRSDPDGEVINSWELMAGLDAIDSFRFSPILPPPKNKENSNPNRPQNDAAQRPISEKNSKNKITGENSILDRFEKICPNGGENRAVIYTTTLRGVRTTFEACNAVRSALEGCGVCLSERDVSMDRGFREELREMMKAKGTEAAVPPRVFVRGRYIGGAEEVLKMAEEGVLGEILQDLPKRRSGSVCEGCGGVRFLPCFRCSGSCKMVMAVKQEMGFQKQQGNGSNTVVVRCPDCNENGLVLCPICT